jgi:hypothetical protein
MPTFFNPTTILINLDRWRASSVFFSVGCPSLIPLCVRVQACHAESARSANSMLLSYWSARHLCRKPLDLPKPLCTPSTPLPLPPSMSVDALVQVGRRGKGHKYTPHICRANGGRFVCSVLFSCSCSSLNPHPRYPLRFSLSTPFALHFNTA